MRPARSQPSNLAGRATRARAGATAFADRRLAESTPTASRAARRYGCKYGFTSQRPSNIQSAARAYKRAVYSLAVRVGARQRKQRPKTRPGLRRRGPEAREDRALPLRRDGERRRREPAVHVFLADLRQTRLGGKASAHLLGDVQDVGDDVGRRRRVRRGAEGVGDRRRELRGEDAPPVRYPTA